MAFTDFQQVSSLTLADRISLRDENREWVTGKVTELALFGDEHITHRITLLLDDGDTLVFHRVPDSTVIYEMGGPE